MSESGKARACCGAQVALVLAAVFAHAPARAEDVIPWSVRTSTGLALMTSSDQRDTSWLGYDRFGIVGVVQLGYRALPWLDALAGVEGGIFLASQPPMGEHEHGGLLAPIAGALATFTHHDLHPYIQLDIGGAFTGSLFKPFLRGSAGLDLALTRAFSIGPVLGYGQVFQTDLPDHGSTDAQYVTVGIGVVYRPVHSVETVPPRRARVVVPAPEPPPAPIEPSTHLMELIERTLPSDPSRVELLAPVLFEFDRDELLPVGVAMLHEVARELEKRPDLELIEIEGYADRRGSAEYNRELSNRRAQRVFDWLVEHGVEPARLRIAAEGATDFVEKGSSEQDHEQNRRVVFRVIKVREP